MKKQAFTLIELLVVIAVIGLLLAVSLPSLQRAKEQARQVYCKNNLRQMASAAHVYAFNHDGHYPITQYSRIVESVTETAFASTGLSVSVIEPPEESQTQTAIYNYCWDFTTITSGDSKQIIPGLLWEGDTIEKVQQCPSYKGQDNWSGAAHSGYNYNTSYIGHGEGESVSNTYAGQVTISPVSGMPIVQSAKAHQVKNTAQCLLFGDGHYAGGANKMMRSPVIWEGDTNWSLRTAGTQGFRHNGQTNCAWADGHVSSQTDYYTETHPKYKPQLDAWNEVNKVKIGFIGPTNSPYDLK
jgi:prepilin-type N-terminal cleavage/methylation domain-containing protein/prepilin-type processing-associated H-X9-DG protein